MKKISKTTFVYNVDNEEESTALVQSYKDEQLTKGYTVLKYKIDYKQKKDRKTGEIIDENWLTEITISYDI